MLLVLQLLAVLAYPFLDDRVTGRSILGVVQIMVVLIAVWAVRRTPALSWVAGTLAVPSMIFSILEAIHPDSGWIILVSAIVHVPFYFYVSYAMIRYLFHDDTVTRDELFATGAAYTVVAWGFAYVYAGAQVIWPGSFVGMNGEDDLPWFELLYLSFTTLTSVGLSDIVPVLGNARSLVMVEMVVGVFYIALVVARLVGLGAMRQLKND
jgi:hypothetical protein